MRYVNKVFFSILLCVIFSVSAFADVLPWPDNDFLNRHESQIEHTTQKYVTYSPYGSVAFYESPGADEIVFEADNYEVIYPCYEYASSSGIWLLVETRRDGQWSSGWCDCGELLALYDSDVFFSEYADEIDGPVTFSNYTGDTVISYAYPGSGIPLENQQIKADEEYLPEFQNSYTDADGRLWGYVSYYRGTRDTWICLTDPYDSSIPFTPMSKTDAYVEQYLIDTLPEITPAERPAPDTPNEAEIHDNNSYLLIGGIAVVVVLAALGIYLLGKKRRKGADS